jgi:anion-transporting  ArsA/GET3 family ATPase
MEAGFKARALAAAEVLRDPATAYVLVTAPRADRLDETEWLADRLAERSIVPTVLVVNRSHPAPYLDVTDAPASLTVAVRRNLDQLAAVASAEQALTGPVVAAARAPVVRVPLFIHDIHDIAGLDLISEHLLR